MIAAAGFGAPGMGIRQREVGLHEIPPRTVAPSSASTRLRRIRVLRPSQFCDVCRRTRRIELRDCERRDGAQPCTPLADTPVG